MKRIIAAALAALILTGCSGSQADSKTEIKKHDMTTDSSNHIQADNIEICSFSCDQIIELLNGQENLSVTDDVVINIPKSAPVLEFTTKMLDNQYDIEQDFDSLYSGFKEMFAYYFPDRSFNEDHLYYVGKESYDEWDDSGNQIKYCHKVKDDMDILKNNKSGSIWFEYDEGRDKEDKSGCLYFNCLPDLNIGGVGQMDKRRYDLNDAKTVAVLPPDSTQSYMLEDKEISVSEAVRFFENTINNSPYPKNRNCELKVAAVKVLNMDNGKYCYNMLCSKDINGILTEFSYGNRTSLQTSKYETIVSSYGYMMKSNEIEMFQACDPYIIMEDVKKYDGISSFENAVKLVSSKLTREVDFEVQRAELVYCQQLIKTAEGSPDIKGYPSRVMPVWKLTLFNPNDLHTYLCYVSADGTDFDYSVIIEL